MTWSQREERKTVRIIHTRFARDYSTKDEPILLDVWCRSCRICFAVACELCFDLEQIRPLFPARSYPASTTRQREPLPQLNQTICRELFLTVRFELQDR